MGSIELHPAVEAVAGTLFPLGFFEVDPCQLAKDKSKASWRPTSKSAGGMRAGQKQLLSAKDFILPERVGYGDNGDLSVSVVGTIDQVQLDQVFRFALYSFHLLPGYSL